MTTEGGDVSSAGEPSGPLLLARGAGLGALSGGVFGLFIAPVTDLLTFRDEAFDPVTFYLGVLTGPVGLLYGLFVGLTVGLVVALLPAERRSATAARLVAATVGPATVALISWFLFRPTLQIGPNQTRDHVIETMVIAYAYPCTSAFLVGVVGGHRLVATTQPDGIPPV